MQSTIRPANGPTEHIASRLRGEVAAGRFHAGEPLREFTLAAEFGVGRTLPAPDGYSVHPRLPQGWPSLTVTGIHFHGQVLDITAHANGRLEVVEK